MFANRHARIRDGFPVDQTPIDSAAEVFGHILQQDVVDFCRSNRELGQSNDCVADIRSTRDAEPREVVFFIGRQFQRRCYLVSRWQGILYPKIVVESIGPEVDVEVRSVKHGANRVGNCTVHTFHRFVLVR